ncbi:hypothetical protein HDIA_2632 [Hartmannibacter diazotrophicus]|uniref:TIGR02117 family protein n=1 Tax=Hartmannibacter diazotrophicus TaxID=1482074 RepID=A0A2C9D7G0_9HYPH|nr:DUF2459 domain-containing protein [Hartmannibacter diazotrophicus]SON56173.1 hypothetical protein HDIA_2632 [Hartmannibacter diazotrophicus]
MAKAATKRKPGTRKKRTKARPFTGLKRVAIVLAAFVAVFAGAIWWTARPGSPLLYPPRAGAATIEVAIANHGWHAGLIVPTDRLRQVAYQDNLSALIDISERFLPHRYLEIGWGDEDFYRNTPVLSLSAIPTAVGALIGGERSTVFHLVGLDNEPRRAFARADVEEIALSEPGFRVLAARLNEAFARNTSGAPVDLGKGLYGDSAFYRAMGTYSLLDTCNHFTGRLLNAAGMAVWPVFDTISAGLMWDIRWHEGGKRAG